MATGANEDREVCESLCELQISNAWIDEAIRRMQIFLPSATYEAEPCWFNSATYQPIRKQNSLLLDEIAAT